MLMEETIGHPEIDQLVGSILTVSVGGDGEGREGGGGPLHHCQPSVKTEILTVASRHSAVSQKVRNRNIPIIDWSCYLLQLKGISVKITALEL